MAADYLAAIGLQSIWEHEQRLTEYALSRLAEIPDLQIYGPTDHEFRGGVVSFNLDGLHPHDLGQVLDSEGIAVRAGHHCAQPLMGALGVGSTTRASFYLYNTEDEIDALIAGIGKAREFFG